MAVSHAATSNPIRAARRVFSKRHLKPGRREWSPDVGISQICGFLSSKPLRRVFAARVFMEFGILAFTLSYADEGELKGRSQSQPSDGASACRKGNTQSDRWSIGRSLFLMAGRRSPRLRQCRLRAVEAAAEESQAERVRRSPWKRESRQKLLRVNRY